MSGSALNSPSARRAAPLTQQLSPFPGGSSSLVSQLAEEMADRWHEGEQPLAEEYLARYPELCGQPEAIVRLIYEEICLRQENGQETASMEVVHRFPQWRQQLEDILCRPFPRRILPLRIPEVGESLGGFHLTAELGNGIRGRVFLASQPALADRPVVLKITSCDGGEHLSLARLQHTHIVPLYSVQDILERNLRILCMPYFGGATLLQIAERLRLKTQGENVKSLDELSGQDLLDALDQNPPTNSPSSVPIRGPCRQLLMQLSYTRAICWIGSCLADALEYAHERGLVHLDLKPSNVLLAADGQPMLLDFHLAQPPLLPDGPPPTWLGGTPAYMSPEQKSAVTAMKQGRSVDSPVDGRSDIYSLGVLLDEALGGFVRKSISESDSGKPSRFKRRSPLTPGLEDLIGKCLRANPADRYPTAAALAADLRRYLGDLPLHGVSNRSWSERWRKWRRRRPYALTLYILSFAFCAATAAAGASAYIQIRNRNLESHQYLSTGQDQLAKGDWDGAIQSLHHGLGLVEALPFCGEIQQELASHLHLARENKAACEFHLLADRIRLRSVADSLSDQDMHDLEESCRAACSSLHLIAQRLGDLKEEDRQNLRNDFLDLAVLAANLRVRLASENDIREARETAMHALEEAETIFGSSSVIEGERQMLAQALGLAKDSNKRADPATPIRPQQAWEFCARGRALLQSGKLEAAEKEFKSAIRMDHGGLWPNYYEGICAYRLGHTKEALQSFSVCVGAAQGTDKTVQAQVLFNRALALSSTGADREAFEDYSRALELDPTMGQATLNRGLLHFKFKNYEQAINDLNSALANGVSPVIVHFNQALVYQAQNQRDPATASARRVLEYQPDHKEAQALLKQLTRQR